jgi:hypothetical protein
VSWVREGGVSFFFICFTARGVSDGWLIVEDDDFVDAEYGQGAGDGAGQVGFGVVRFGVADYGRCYSDGDGGFAWISWGEDSGWFGCVWFIGVSVDGAGVAGEFSFLGRVSEIEIGKSVMVLPCLSASWIDLYENRIQSRSHFDASNQHQNL